MIMGEATMVKNKDATPLEQVLYEFSFEKTVPDAELLEDYVKRFPEYAAALTDLAVAIALDTEIEAKQEGRTTPSRYGLGTMDVARCRKDEFIALNCILGAEISPAVSRAMSRFQNRGSRKPKGPEPEELGAVKARTESKKQSNST
jgi:hypothetical protein